MRAFENRGYDYYELTQPLGFDGRDYLIPDGAIFVHDKNDSIRGSIAEGCLKLCYTPDGQCYGSLCGDTVVFHAHFRYSDLFKKVDIQKINELEELIINLENQLNEAKHRLNNIKGK